MAETKENYVSELLSTDIGNEGNLLIPRKIHDVLWEEVPKALIPRSEAALYMGPGAVPGSSYDIDLEDENIMDVRLIAEGTEVILDQDAYSVINVKPLKYGVAIRITKEMMEDSKWNLLERNIKKAGKRFAENETNLILTQLQSCTNNVAGGTALTIANITRAMQYLDDTDYEPTSFLIGMEVLNDLRNIDTFVEAQKVGNTDMLQRGFIGVIYGMNVMKFSTNAAPSSTYSKYAYVYDKAQAYAIIEKRTVTVENFMLPTFDMSGAALTQRIAAELLRDNAVCRISTS